MSDMTYNIFGLRIRRASDLIGEQGREAFWRAGIELDAKLISLVVALYEQSEQSSSELAARTGLSRQVEEGRLKTLERAGYVTSSISREDARKRVFSLTKKRKREIEEAVEMMVDFEQVYENLWDEIGVDLGEAMVKLERALLAKPLLARLCEQFPQYQENLKVSSHDR